MIRHIFNICEHIGSTTRLLLVFLGRVGPITVTILFHLIEAKEILLGVATNLAASTSTDVLLDISPVFTIHLETFQKAPMFSISPPTSWLFGSWRFIKRLGLLSEYQIALFGHSWLGIQTSERGAVIENSEVGGTFKGARYLSEFFLCGFSQCRIEFVDSFDVTLSVRIRSCKISAQICVGLWNRLLKDVTRRVRSSWRE